MTGYDLAGLMMSAVVLVYEAMVNSMNFLYSEDDPTATLDSVKHRPQQVPVSAATKDHSYPASLIASNACSMATSTCSTSYPYSLSLSTSLVESSLQFERGPRTMLWSSSVKFSHVRDGRTILLKCSRMVLFERMPGLVCGVFG